jgi:hypothetical protein
MVGGQGRGRRRLGPYIRAQLVGSKAAARPVRQPTVDHQKLVLVLAALGQSRLSANKRYLYEWKTVDVLSQ